MSAVRTRPTRDAATQPTMRDRACCGSRYCMPMKRRSPRFRALTRSARPDDATVVARARRGVVRRIEQRDDPRLRVDQEDGRRVIYGVISVCIPRADEYRDPEVLGQRVELAGRAGEPRERRVEMRDVA